MRWLGNIAIVLDRVRPAWARGIWWLDKRQKARTRQLEAQVGGHLFRSASNATMAAVALAMGATMMGEWDLDGGGSSTAVNNLTVFNVQEAPFNATGNGTTDDTAAITAAYTAEQAAGGGIVYFPPAVKGQFYLVSSTFSVGGGNPGAGVTMGAGWSSQVKLANASNVYMFDFGKSNAPQFTNGYVFRDIYLNCNGANQTTAGGGVYARGAVWCVFDHVWFETPWEAGIRFYQDGAGNYGHHNTMLNCLFRDGKNSNGGNGWAIKFEQADENRCIGCTFQDNANHLGTGHDAQVYDTGAGLQSFIGNAWVGGGTSCAFVKSDSNPGRCMFVGNAFDGPNKADCLDLTGSLHTITGNSFLHVGQGQTSGQVGGVHLDGATLCNVVGNDFNGDTAFASAVYETGAANSNNIGPNTYTGTWLNSIPVVTIGANTQTTPNSRFESSADMNIAASFDPNFCSGTHLLIGQTLYLQKVPIVKVMSIGHVLIRATSTSVGASSGSYVGVYGSDGTLLGQSADQATITGYMNIAMVTPFIVDPTVYAFVWVGIYVNYATTQPTLGSAPVTDSTVNNLGTVTATLRSATNGTSLGTLAALPSPITPSSNSTTGSFPLWAAVAA